MKTIISSQRTSLSFDYENQRELMKEERFAGKQNSAGEMGHRIAKHVYTSANVLEKSTYYVLDAQGNTMATYERGVDENTLQISYAQTEKFIYGSSRLGVQNCNIALLGSQNNTYTQTTVAHRIGKKGYELSNHLGNVLSVISDKVIPHSNGAIVDYWQADILQSTDYSPFGVQLNNRTLNKNGVTDFVRFGFQNQEEDPETGLVNYKYRMHDPRLGRFFAIDPLAGKFPWNSVYAFSENRVFDAIELEGSEARLIHSFKIPFTQVAFTFAFPKYNKIPGSRIFWIRRQKTIGDQPSEKCFEIITSEKIIEQKIEITQTIIPSGNYYPYDDLGTTDQSGIVTKNLNSAGGVQLDFDPFGAADRLTVKSLDNGQEIYDNGKNGSVLQPDKPIIIEPCTNYSVTTEPICGGQYKLDVLSLSYNLVTTTNIYENDKLVSTKTESVPTDFTPCNYTPIAPIITFKSRIETNTKKVEVPCTD